MRITILLVAVSCGMLLGVVAAAQTVKPAPSIEVTAPKDLTTVLGLSDALSALSEKVTACSKSAKKPETCPCSYPQELTGLKKHYADAIRQHPEWKDQLLSYQRPPKEGHNINGSLNMEGLRRQLEFLKCK